MFLAIDVGNTAVKAGLHDGRGWARVARLPSDDAAAATWAARLVEALGGEGRVEAAGLASVAPGRTGPVAAGAEGAFGVRPRVLAPPYGAAGGGEPRVGPLRLAYATPATLGADRLAAAAAAWARFRAPAGAPPRAVVAVDVGTAATVDVVDAAGRYVGGAILPGPEALVRALARGTAQLPEVPFALPPSPVGGSTAACIQAGVGYLFLDGVGGLLARTRATVEAPGRAVVVATGGWGAWLAEHLPGEVDAAEPHLVLDGVRLLCSSRGVGGVVASVE